MTSKVLLADDSLTIQKVVSITFTNEPLELSTCNNHEELKSLLANESFDLLLLDFNLDEEMSGYDICSQAKELKPELKIIILYGTFDTIIEEKLQSHKVDAHIVKPFDGGKFLTLCKDVIKKNGTADSGEISNSKIENSNPVVESAETNTNNANDDSWNINENVMNSHHSSDLTSTKEISREEKSQLLKDVESWGIDVPPVIADFESADDFSVEFPPVIEGANDESAETFDIDETGSFELNELTKREEADLESAVYDDEELLSESQPSSIEEELELETETNAPVSEEDGDINLVDLSGEEEEKLELEVEQKFTVEDVNAADEITEEDLWSEDQDFQPAGDEVSQIQLGKEEESLVIESHSDNTDPSVEVNLDHIEKLEIEEKDQPTGNIVVEDPLELEETEKSSVELPEEVLHKKDQSGFVQIDLNTMPDKKEIDLELSSVSIEEEVQKTAPEPSISDASNLKLETDLNSHIAAAKESHTIANKIDEDQLKEIIERVVRDVVKEELDKVFSQGVDKVAWEIIPDLAENLIKNQLQSISDKILEE